MSSKYVGGQQSRSGNQNANSQRRLDQRDAGPLDAPIPQLRLAPADRSAGASRWFGTPWTVLAGTAGAAIEAVFGSDLGQAVEPRRVFPQQFLPLFGRVVAGLLIDHVP